MNVPTVFVRFQGCNLPPRGCSWCDTKYAQREGGSDLTVDEILGHTCFVAAKPLNSTGRKHVCITGGEPLSHAEDVRTLIRCIHSRECAEVEIFTNGTLPVPSWCNLVASFVVDIKCPSSGVESVCVSDWFKMRCCDQVKFVVANKDDIRYVRSLHPEATCRPEVIISPMIPLSSHPLDTEELEWARYVIGFCKEYGYRFSWQQHKLLYGNKRGV